MNAPAKISPTLRAAHTAHVHAVSPRHTALMRETHRDHWNDAASNDVFVDVRDCVVFFSTRCGLHEIHPTVELALARAHQFIAGGK